MGVEGIGGIDVLLRPSLVAARASFRFAESFGGCTSQNDCVSKSGKYLHLVA
jgi:hypothetical protein